MSGVSLGRRLLLAATATSLLTGAAAFGAYTIVADLSRRSVDADIRAVADAAIATGTGGLPGAPGRPPDPSAGGTTGSEPVGGEPAGRIQVTITGQDDSVVSGPGTVGEVTVADLADGWHTIDGWRILVRSRPRGGAVIVSGYIAATEDALALTRYALVAAAAGTVLAVGATLHWVWRRGIRPLAQITATARRVAGGARTERIDPSGLTLEAAALASTVNQLIDSQETARRSWETSSEQQRRFLIDAGHELRTPLTVIRGWADLLARDQVTGEQAAGAHQRVAAEAARMSRLVDQLLDVARAENRAEQLADVTTGSAPATVLAALCAMAADDHRMLDRSRPVELIVDPDANVAAEADTVNQIVTNLLANLRAHTPAGTRARISGRTRAGAVELVYDDNGPGVAEPARIFDRFWQADPSRTGHGTGLGMALVRALAERAGGTATAARSPDGGLQVSVRLPAA